MWVCASLTLVRHRCTISTITTLKIKNRDKLLFTDTDSLTYLIEAEDVYQDFWYDKDKFDNSDYPENSRYHDKTNKKVIGKFKDKAASIPIVEFIDLKSKMYI